MKTAVIVHGWGGNPNNYWFPSLKKVLENQDFKVFVPQMPDPKSPNLDKWLQVINNLIKHPDKNTFLIGYSAGCITIIRYLELLKKNEKVGGVVLIAGFSEDLGYSELNTFFRKPLNFSYIKTKADYFTAIHSTNDPYVNIKFGEIFKKYLNAKLIMLPNMGHFSDSVNTLPEVSKAVFTMI